SGALHSDRGHWCRPRNRRFDVRPLRQALLGGRTGAQDGVARVQRRARWRGRHRVKVTQFVPSVEAAIPLADALAALRDPRRRLAPFAPETVEFSQRLSLALFRDPAARAFPELQALAYWLRKSEITRMRAQFDAISSDSTVLVPRGLVF